MTEERPFNDGILRIKHFARFTTESSYAGRISLVYIKYIRGNMSY